jgi:hypothetical protein
VNRPYYNEINLEPSYSNGHLYEQVYDDRNLHDEEEDSVVGTWENLKTQLQPEEEV